VLSRLAATAAAEGEAPQMIDACDLPAPPRRWGWVIPTAMLAVLPLGRLAPGPRPPDAASLHEKASRAYAEGRFADAAEYARHAIVPSQRTNLHAELLALRGESLLRAQQPAQAAEAFESLLGQDGGGAYAPQALFGAAHAEAALGNLAAAERYRQRLLADHAGTPWAERMLKEPAVPVALP
jgi:tetratricopeptide (TPR) repeat protein